MNCPKCGAEMDNKKIDEVEIDVCTGCAGIFLDDGEFESFTGIDPATGLIRLTKFMNVLSKLNERAVIDELTQIYTRKYYNEFMSSVFSNQKRGPLCMALSDIDYFKEINTKFGHDGGDAVLRGVADAMKHSLRTSRDDNIFRLGGEEFGVVLFGLTPDDARNAAETLRKVVAATPLRLPSGVETNVTLSIGVALGRADDTAESLYKRADELLYAAKNNGRNRVVLDGDAK